MAPRALRTIDNARPKAEVHGLPGVAFEQDGILFSSAGVEALPEDYAQAPEEVPAPDNPNDPHIGLVVVESEPEPQQTQQAGDHFDSMHHMTLKALMKQYSLEWTDRDDAISQLRNLKKSA